ncbi:DUF2231 domain-containing protein [Desulforhopalus singaporensis]|uniref:Uncharacterized membrane protein n=1 Tax=Desulforhopalus singaporensis TaxID=91360 RepID=A0A1H0MHE8_9BACT|nr:DUF2231 domain-containing protein [Desulforhopalus singaporensis]SDO79781.1 Uncharacterized membrane protein [Desulforhopalus singaporensis]
MVESLYSLLEKIGITHPLHPMLTHAPMGMIIGMVVFSFLALFWRNGTLDRSAYHCSILAFISVFPVIVAGLLDWVHLQSAEWNIFIIVKMILAVVLTVLLGLSIKLKRNDSSRRKMFLIYLACLLCAGGLGFSGGELVYG